MKFDLHIHSMYSFDSLSDPRDILKKARIKDLDTISITDHNNMEAYKKISNDTEVTVIPGMEISTNKGDVIGLFLRETISKTNFFEVIDEIRKQDGVIVLSHPYRRNCDPVDLVEYVDLIEVENGRLRKKKNLEAWNLYKETDFTQKPISGSDAHASFEIGSVITEIEGFIDDVDEIRKMLLKNERKIYGKGSPYLFAHSYSFISSIIKRLRKKS